MPGESQPPPSVLDQDGVRAIPVMTEIPLTRREIRARKVRRVMYVVAAIVAAITALLIALHLFHVAAVEAAMLKVGDDGRPSSVAAALETIGDDDSEADRALRARLHAQAELAGLEDHGARVAPLLEGLRLTGDEGANQLIAEAYHALAALTPIDASEKVGQLVPVGTFAGEIAYAKALAALCVGNVAVAAEAIGTALEARPDAPRYLTLSAQVMARQGDAAAALARLSAVPADARTSEVAMAEARLQWELNADAAATNRLADGILADADATPREKAWAGLLKARASAEAGERATARQGATEAEASAPPGDEAFLLTLAETFLRIDAAADGQRVLDRWTAPVSSNAGRRDQAIAELSLLRGDVERAGQLLRGAPEGPRTTLLAARRQHQRRQADDARRLYGRAIEAPATRLAAVVGLATLELESGRAAAALEALRPLLADHPNHPELVWALVEARIAEGNVDGALAAADEALAVHPRSARLMSAKAHAQMAREQWDEALATLRAALEIDPHDADLHGDRGVAARRAGHQDEARAAFDEALRLDELHGSSLVGLLHLDLAAGNLDASRATLDKIDRAGLSSLEIDRLRARFLVMDVAGQDGVRTVREALRRSEDDRELNYAMGMLYMQAEQWLRAVTAFSRAADEGDVDALVRKTFAQVRARLEGPAQETMDAITEATRDDPMEDRLRSVYTAARGRLAWQRRRRSNAVQLARRALELDSGNGEAHLLLADYADVNDLDTTAHLEAAATAREPQPIAMARLSLGRALGEESCDLARRYRRAAPRGAWIRLINDRLRRCP